MRNTVDWEIFVVKNFFLIDALSDESCTYTQLPTKIRLRNQFFTDESVLYRVYLGIIICRSACSADSPRGSCAMW